LLRLDDNRADQGKYYGESVELGLHPLGLRMFSMHFATSWWCGSDWDIE